VIQNRIRNNFLSAKK